MTGFARRVVVVGPGRRLDYDAGDWQDALVTVASGRIELVAAGGATRCFGRGDVVCLSGIACRNPGPDPAVLVAVARDR